MKLKVCGMRNAENIRELVKLQPDYIGFIFYEKSKRYAGAELEPQLVLNLPSSIQKVGVFVNASIEYIKEQIEKYQLHVVQLHGDEIPEACAIAKATGITVIKAFSVDSAFDFSSTMPYESVCDYFLFDTKGEGYGGTGKSFDWSILTKYNNKVPFLLSGGIDLEHAERIKDLKGFNLHAVDINSRFEIEPGLKDINKIRQFIKLIEI
ncbi:MAG TPA: phosphoribosylanthranilate isomerase [Cytophagaceae bacterium]